MPEETRIALLPAHIPLISDPKSLFFERNYGQRLGISDMEYRNKGSHTISRNKMHLADIICCPKRWNHDESVFSEGQTIIGWLYVDQTPWLSKAISEKKLSAIAFEKMNYCDGKYVFEENRFITGYIGALQSIPYAGAPAEKLKIAVLGRGNVAKGVFDVLNKLEATYQVFFRQNIHDFFAKIGEWDLIFNCVKWQEKSGYLITFDNIIHMKPGCVLADLSTEGIQGSKPQNIFKPVYVLKKIIIYNNWHIPTLWAKYASEKISEAFAPFANDLVNETKHPVLERATVAIEGKILDC